MRTNNMTRNPVAKRYRVKPNISLATKSARILRDFVFENYRDGGKIPGEYQLAEQLGVNRGTVRQALRILEQEGIIIRRQGDGTYANSHVIGIKSRIDEITEYKVLIGNSGYKATTIQLDVTEEIATLEIAEKLEIDPESTLLVSRNLLLADDNPAIYVEDKIPLSLIREEYLKEELEDSVFDFLLNRCYQEAAYTVSSIVPRRCGEELAKILQVKPWQPLLQSTGVVYSVENNPIMVSASHYREPFIRFHVVRKRKF